MRVIKLSLVAANVPMSLMYQYLHHKMPIYRDCTLAEILGLGIMILLALSVILGLLTHLLFNYAFIGIGIGTLLLVPLTRLACSALQKIKYDKPYGYYQLQLQIKLMRFKHYPFIVKSQLWSTQRSLP